MKNGTVTKRFFVGATRLAARSGTGGTLSFLLGDHLGSSSVTTYANGAKTASALYKAFGETRYTLGNLSTDYKFTGQREEASLGIYFFNARWYDSSLGRFLSPDTIVPTSTQGTQAWDRYAFVNNNPVRYTDPTGHMITGDGPSHFDHTNSSTDPCLRYGKGSPQCPNSPDDNLDDIVEPEDNDSGKCSGLCAPALPNNPSEQTQTAASSQTTVNMRWVATGLIAIGVAIAVTAIIFSPFGVAALAAIGIGGLTAFSSTTLAGLALLATAFIGGGALVNSTAGAMDAQASLPTATPAPTATPTAPFGAPFNLVTPTGTPNR
ncbi:MAG: RHS repeat-associated core domain-containing protein [Chloroflexota bacterium]